MSPHAYNCVANFMYDDVVLVFWCSKLGVPTKKSIILEGLAVA
jgi:hypothetical protein